MYTIVDNYFFLYRKGTNKKRERTVIYNTVYTIIINEVYVMIILSSSIISATLGKLSKLLHQSKVNHEVIKYIHMVFPRGRCFISLPRKKYT